MDLPSYVHFACAPRVSPPPSRQARCSAPSQMLGSLAMFLHSVTWALLPFILFTFVGIVRCKGVSNIWDSRVAQTMGRSYEEYEIRRCNPNPKNAALVVIDMQVYFRETTTPILPVIHHTIESCRAQNIPVVYTRHSHKHPLDYGMQEEWWNSVIHGGTPEAELMPEVDRRVTDKLVHKHTYSGFYDTDLEQYLQEQGKSEVIITGVVTNLCCEMTARDAFNRGFRVFFSTNATATTNEDFHDSTLKNLAYGFSYLVNCQRLEDAFTVKNIV